MNKRDEAWRDVGYLDEYHKGNLGYFVTTNIIVKSNYINVIHPPFFFKIHSTRCHRPTLCGTVAQSGQVRPIHHGLLGKRNLT